MLRLHIKAIAQPDPDPGDIPGSQCTLTLPDPITRMLSLQDFITYLTEHPEVIILLLQAFLYLFGAPSPEPQTPEKPGPPKR